ncbi:hypothetical protein MD484_g2593, partial [Candolleomyces efflorescens]
MPPDPKKRHLWPRVRSLFGGRRSTVDDSHQDANAVVGPTQSDPASAHSVPSLPLPVSIGERNSGFSAPYSHLATPMSHGGTTSFLAGASGFQMGDIQYIDAPNAHVTVHTGGNAGARSIDGWEMLLKETSADALHNSRARYDAPKCDEDTRVEVTSEIMEFIENSDGPRRLLCMTGAAGSGKSALEQTIAEICSRNGSLASSYFFSSTDPNRNTVTPVIPTIAYQLGRGNPPVKQLIKAAVEDDPLIFSQSLEDQITTLIVKPFKCVSDAGLDLRTLPYAILIDGLDECKSEDSQAELLTSIRKCLLVDWLPFRIFIASRPEWAIRTALQPGGHLHQLAYHIQLSDQYDATGDMRRYLRRRFEDIGLSINDPHWFTDDNIETLVQAASGQFIYVATVFKYVSERRASPVERLKIILTWTPRAGQKTRPFEALDRLYTNIVLAAKDAYEAIDSHDGRDFLLLLRAYHVNLAGIRVYRDDVSLPAGRLSVGWLGLEAKAEENLVSDLHSLVKFDSTNHLQLYHKSFSDFFGAESRAGALFVSEALVYAHLSKCFMRRIINDQIAFDSIPDILELPMRQFTLDQVELAVDYLPAILSSAAVAINSFDDAIADFAQNGGWDKIDSLLPHLYHTGRSPTLNRFKMWVRSMRQFVDNVNTPNPAVAAAVNEYVVKWEGYEAEWQDELTKNV